MIVYPNLVSTVHNRIPLVGKGPLFTRWVFFCVNDRGKAVRYYMGETIWRDGYPKRTGYYKCLIDGELEMTLKYYVCQVSCKPHWVDNNGDYIETMGKVQWTGEPIR